MSGFRDIAKGGWHPKGKDGKSKESWRGDFKGIDQIAVWRGKGRDPNAKDEDEHISRPISTLKDPAAFGPPPKNVNYHGGAALPNQITPDTRGWGAPLSKGELEAKQLAKEEEDRRQAEEAAKPIGPPIPYRKDTTGLSTAHLPPPPGRKDGADGRSPGPTPAANTSKPRLPPRLPPRQDSKPALSPAAGASDAHKSILNQDSLNRLGAAGISVPGFGVVNKPKAPLPPPAPSSPSRSPAPTQSSTGDISQLNELQSRFSRLSSKPPKPEAPSQGTTFAQKQAALKTASSFRNDPSSISLSDARSAANTAKNFRERHGEQVKSGWQSANTLNAKYGITDKVDSHGGGNTVAPVPDVGIDTRDNTLGPEHGVPGKKKPPPPPIKRADLALSPAIQTGVPPPIPLSSKPRPQPSRSPEPRVQMEDLDLDLKSLWFTKQPVAFPPASINRLPGSRTYASSSGWSSTGVRKTYTFIGAIRDTTTLGTTIVRLTWDGSNPGVTVKAQQRHVPPPRKLSRSELEAYRDQYSDAVAAWSESQIGRQVGNGECWTLANNALIAVGGQCSSRGQVPCMPSQSYTHGHIVYSFIPAKSPYPEPRGGLLEAGIARGDIIQLLSAHFKSPDGGQKWAGAPDHTAVITGVGPNEVLRVVESNAGGVKTVQKGEYNMKEMVKGEVRIFRAVGTDWAGELDPKW
ncbi:altered inheritance [Hyphodiscus hymeniophilus]|uniref:Altered inheritance n=1 Tax=Hyphodiscus hymeniophilus TaxID=353542 RepID=A0A9P6VRA9_9HELO|nr:altered inheritance [Hyphodiscus hymeniophilus]